MELNLYFIQFKAESDCVQCIYHYQPFERLSSRFFKSIQTYFNVHIQPWDILKLNVMDSFPALVFGIFSIRCCWMGRYIAIYCKGRRFFEKLDYWKYTVSQLFHFFGCESMSTCKASYILFPFIKKYLSPQRWDFWLC